MPAQSSATAGAPDWSIQLGLIADANAARKSGDYAAARAMAAEVVTYLLARAESEQDANWLAVLDAAGRAAHQAADARSAKAALERVLAVLSRTRFDDDPELQEARSNLAAALTSWGELPRARALEEKVLEVYARTLPDDHPDLQRARSNLASTLQSLGEIPSARALQEKVLDVRSRTLSDEHPDLQVARMNLAGTIKDQGDLPAARALEEKVLDVYSRTLPEFHPRLQVARSNLAATIFVQGDLPGARALQAKVLEAFSRTLPDEHSDLQVARFNLAATLRAQGDLRGAQRLFEKVIEVLSRTVSPDDPGLQFARGGLAATIKLEGDLAVARALQQSVLEVFSRTRPEGHHDLQEARQSLAATMKAQGDLAGARELEEKLLEVRSRTLPDDHPSLQTARMNFAITLYYLRDYAAARALQEKVLEVRERTLPEAHPELQVTRGNLALTMQAQGDLSGARALGESVLEISSRALPDAHPDVQAARVNLAGTIIAQGDVAAARALLEKVLEVRSRTLPDDHPALQWTRQNLAIAIATGLVRSAKAAHGGERSSEWEDERARCTRVVGDLCRAQVHAALSAILCSSAREAEERCSSVRSLFDVSCSFARGIGGLEPFSELVLPAFQFSETTRSAAIAAAGISRDAASSPGYAELRATVRESGEALAALARSGATRDELDRARAKRETAEKTLAELARESFGKGTQGLEIDARSFAERLGAGAAAVAFRRFTFTRIESSDAVDPSQDREMQQPDEERLCAFVVRGGTSAHAADSSVAGSLSLVDMGPIAPIERAVEGWRAALGVAADSRGVALAWGAEEHDARALAEGLRAKVFDPLVPALAGAGRIVVVLDDVLHLVPLDALPLDDTMLVGDRWRIETRATLTELSLSTGARDAADALVAFGDVDYGDAMLGDDSGGTNESSDGGSHEATAAGGSARTAPGIHPGDALAAAVAHDTTAAYAESGDRGARPAAILRGSAWANGFAALPSTAAEVRGLASLFAAQRAGETCELGAGTSATRARLQELVPKARFLHLATHGWFAPESMPSWSDPEPLDKLAGLGVRQSAEERVRGMNPMLLCGLALAGANLPEDAVGRAPGLITAEEISTLDLSSCELAVLSACDTNVGERRAGQGVASLQKALQMAGARSVITSLWKVPDEATKELMLDFYRRLWVEKKPKHQALWEAKTKLREAKDERGEPRYTTRDWAAWVLTGAQD